MKNFTNKYSLAKTLRFELKPVGSTKEIFAKWAEKIKYETVEGKKNLLYQETVEGKKNLLYQDEKRAESYQLMKKTIDGFHKHFIEIAMKEVHLEQLTEYTELYHASAERKKEDKYKEELKKVQEALRKDVVKGFNSKTAENYYKKIDTKELFTELLKNWIPNDKMVTELTVWNAKTKEEKEHFVYFDKGFENFTTYFGGFHKNRENMYTDKEQRTAIAYRLIHENLPKFLDNVKIFNQITEKFDASKIEEIENKLEAVIQGTRLAEIFTLDYYNNVLTQTGIDFINNIIGGYTENEGKTKVPGLNEFVNNEYNQKQEKNNRIPKFKILYKQILSDRDSISWLPEAFEDDKDKSASQKVLEAINLYYRDNILCFQPKDKKDTENVLEETKKLLADLPDSDLSKIYIRNDRAITDISQAIFEDYSVIKDALKFQFRTITYPELKRKHKINLEEYKEFSTEKKKSAKKPKLEREEKELEKYLKQAYFSIAEIENALFACQKETDTLKEIKENSQLIAHYFINHFKSKIENDSNKEFDLIANIEAKYSCIKGILNGDNLKDKKLNHDKKTIGDIKAFLDALMELLHFVKPLALPNDSTLEKDEYFYSHFESYYEQLVLLTHLYNKVRNYATKKPYSTEKIKLNFENPEFLGGWPRDREIATSSVIFKDEKNFYLGVLDKDSKRYFKNFPKPKDEQDVFNKMVYLQAADPSKDVQNLMVIDGKTVKKNGRKEKSGEFIGQNLILEELKNTHLPENINEIRRNRAYSKQSDNFSKNDLVAFIDYYKQRTIEYFDSYKFKFKNSDEYKDFGEFTTHINEQAYQINFIEISRKYIDDWVNTGKLYLFQFYNKDFSPYSKGKPNMHTLYWKALFDEQNLKDVVYKLNGQAEVFFRKESVQDDNIVVHDKNIKIARKFFKDGNKTERVPDETVQRLNKFYKGQIQESELKKEDINYKENYSLFHDKGKDIDIIKDKRYTVDKFQFHVPITINFKAPESLPSEKKQIYGFNSKINNSVKQFIKDNGVEHIIGLDRGERHLIYLTLIDIQGNIKEQYSLNDIINNHKGDEYKTDYWDLLRKKEGEIDKAQKDWGAIENIKELKEGYLSQVVHKISKLIVQYNAIVVMEDLNFGFKRIRQGISKKSVYQKFEKMLIDKLNYLVFKEPENNEPGLYNAYQLSGKYHLEVLERQKQSGFLFYVPAWNTSKIDPTTGFVNLFYTKYESVPKAQEFFKNFESIKYNTAKNYFEFEVADYTKFNPKAAETILDWRICTYGDRIEKYKSKETNPKWIDKRIDLTEQFKDLFGKFKITYDDGTCIKEQIISQTNKSFFHNDFKDESNKLNGLLQLYKLTLQMRNSITDSTKPEDDYLISPVMNNKGSFYDSRKADSTLPKDADANGAYHIAKKGLMWLQRIREFESYKKDTGELDWNQLELDKTNKGWLRFVQK
jgi:CRISPR-associated protein Cpf1